MSGTLLKPRFKNIPVFYTAEPVGPIGDVNQIVKFKHSAPDLPLRFGTTFAGPRVGQNVQDGLYPSFSTGGYGANSIVLGFGRPDNVTTGGGFTFQDIVPEDRLIIPETIPLPSYSWENLKAETYKAQVSGQQFLPLPGAFAPMPGSVPRGGAVPQISSAGQGSYAGSFASEGYGAGAINGPTLAQDNASPYNQMQGLYQGLAAGIQGPAPVGIAALVNQNRR